MPTAADYRSAAEDFSALARSMTATVHPLRSSITDDVVHGGRLRVTLEDALEAVAAGFGASAAHYEAVADECRRRAAACEASTAALRATGSGH